MKRTVPIMLSLLLTFALILPVLGEGEVDTVASTSMFLSMTEGDVSVTNMAGDSLDLTEDMRLFNGCTVDTAAESYAWVTLDDSKFVTLDQLTSASIHKENYDLLLTVNDGTMYFNVTEKLRDDESMEIQTATMITGIRGTSGRVVTDRDGNTTLTLLEGVVTVSAVSLEGKPIGETVTLYPGNSISSHKDGSGDGFLDLPVSTAGMAEIVIPDSLLSPCTHPDGHSFKNADTSYTCTPDEMLCTALTRCVHCGTPLSITERNHVVSETPAYCETEGTVEREARFTPYNDLYRNFDLTLKDHTCSGTIPATGHRWPKPMFVWSGMDSCEAIRHCLNNYNHIEKQTARLTVEVTDPTCTADGLRTVTATARMHGTEHSNTRSEAIPATGHSLTAIAQVPATCTAKGTAAYWACKNCGALFSDAAGTAAISAPVDIPATGHSLTATAAVPATCTAKGTAAYWTCKNCGALFSDAAGTAAISAPVDIPATGHNMTATAAVPATCTAKGTAAYWTCKNCGGLFSDAAGTAAISAPMDIPATGHSLTAVAQVPATCTARGTAAYWTCKNCGALFSDAAGTAAISAPVDIPATGHSLTAVAQVPATCTTNGNVAYWKCKNCNALFSDAAGTAAITGSVDIPATGHSLTATAAVPATCTRTGIAAYWTCSVCNGHFSDAAGTTAISSPVILPTIAHTLTAIPEVPACTGKGVAAYWVCNVCSNLFSDAAATNAIPAPVSLPIDDHKKVYLYSWDLGTQTGTASAATCTGTCKCQACGYVFKTLTIPALISGNNYIAPFSDKDPDFMDQTTPIPGT